MPRLSIAFLLLLIAAVHPPASADDHLFDETRATTLFAFDNVSIPFTQGLALEMRTPEKHPANPVVRRGGPGSVDSWAVQFYGSVIHDEGKFRMWYCAVGEDRLDESVPRSEPWRVAYAESDDGVNWTKPSLGLVDYHGSTDNNLVKMNPHIGTLNVKVIKDEDDPDPSRRYKMAAHVWYPNGEKRHGTLAPYASADGLTWDLLVHAEPVAAEIQHADMVLPVDHYEPAGGLYKWDGLYYLSGQNALPAPRPYHGRVVRGFVSPDFVNWHGMSAVGMVRTAQHKLGQGRGGEQTHEGVSVWNRGNMLVGIGGMWHGADEWPDVTIDLGLVLSNDGVYFREPSHDFVFIKRGEDGQWDQGGLLQGQGFENVGEQTYVYYGAWDPRHWQDAPARGGVGIVTLPRDRFGHLVVSEHEDNDPLHEDPRAFLTTAVELEGDGPRRLYVNADGLGDDAALKVELLTHNAEFIPAYSGENAAVVRKSGFQSPVEWNGKDRLGDLPDRVRIKVSFEGTKKTDIRFCAMYVR